MDAFLTQLNEHNLCTWYLLPLTGLNALSFGGGNFIDCYVVITESSMKVVGVSVRDLRICKDLVNHPCFYGVSSFESGEQLIMFSLQEKWTEDYGQFIKGRYSKLSEDAKEQIRSYSGLRYKVVSSADEQSVTDAVLMALEKNEVLRNHWIELLGIPDEVMPDEYLSIPRPENFVKLIRK